MSLIPRQTKAQIKIGWGLSLGRLMGLFVTLFAALIFGNLVHKYLRIPFYFICIGIYFVYNIKSPVNPKKHIWQSCIDCWSYLFRQKKYMSVIGQAFSQVIKEVDIGREDESQSIETGQD